MKLLEVNLVLTILTTWHLASSLDIVTLNFSPESGDKSLDDSFVSVSTNPGKYSGK